MDQDIDLSLDDEVEDQPLEEDELLKYLEDDEPDDSEEGKRKAAEEEEARLQAIVDRKIADRFVQRDPDPKPKREPDGPPREAQNIDEVFERMADDIVSDFAVDPKKAVKKMLETSRALANKGSEDSAERTNRLLIEQYRTSKAGDKVFQASKEEFDEIVAGYTPEALSKATPAQVRKALEDAEDTAFGRYQRKQLTAKQTRQAAPPPPYGGSRGSSRGTTQARVLTKEDRDLIKMGKSAGLSEKEIKELIRENRN